MGKIIGALLLAMASSAMAGPFGFTQGEKLGDLQKRLQLKRESPTTFSTARAPSGHPDLEEYRLLITPGTGLCKITGWTTDKQTNSQGVQVQDEFDQWFQALSEKYGPGKKYDFLEQGSIWNDPQDWLTALAKEERTLAAFWTSLPSNADNISAIRLKAHGLVNGKFMISIGYEYNHHDQCLREAKAKKNSNL